jgi:MYXO-CTERM domain-containing protein
VIGGVIVAQATKAITEGQAHDLRALLALFLLGLIVGISTRRRR